MKKWDAVAIAVFVLNILLPPSMGEEVGSKISSCSLLEAINIAIKSNFNIKSSEENIKSARSELEVKKGERLPEAKLNITGSSTKFYGDGLPSVSSKQYDANISLNLTQHLYTGGRITNGIKQAECQKQMAFQDLKTTENNIIFSVKNNYWNTKKVRLLIDVTEELINSTKEVLKITEERYKIGSLSKLDLQQSQAYLIELENSLLQLNTEYIIAKNNFLKSLNLVDNNKESDVEVILTDSPEKEIEKIRYETRDLVETIECALNSRSELKKNKNEIEVKKYAIGVAKSTGLPQFDLTGEYTLIGQDAATFNNAWHDVKKKSEKIMFSVSIPVFDRWITKTNVFKAKNELEISKNSYEDMRQSVIKEAKGCFYKLDKDKKKLDFLEKVLYLRKENYLMARLQYDLNTISFYQLNDFQKDFLGAKINYVNALVDLILTQAEFEKTVEKQI